MSLTWRCVFGFFIMTNVLSAGAFAALGNWSQVTYNIFAATMLGLLWIANEENARLRKRVEKQTLSITINRADSGEVMHEVTRALNEYRRNIGGGVR